MVTIRIIFIFIFLMFMPRTYGEAPVAADFVKAAFIFHFLNFTQWDDNQGIYVVCIPDDPSLRDAARV
jgi:hypothetical protein